jgi:mono/diheme cytochrome c family protein
MKTHKSILSFILIGLLYFLFASFNNTVQEKWIAPASADEIINPIKNDPSTSVSGKKLFRVLCSVCHGVQGKGDGMGSSGLTPKPTNFSTDAFQSQTDGAIFWKIAEGRAPMASYETSIPEKKRWEIINYIRTLKK